jgi:MinD-like ATPase involved in chromosome partitioning or flagellar assembly
MTQSKNGWGPAAPATNSDTATVEPHTGAYEEVEEFATEETTNEEAAPNSRRVYTGSEEATREEGTEQESKEQESKEQTYDTGPEDGEEISEGADTQTASLDEPEDIEEFGPEPETGNEPGFTRDGQTSKFAPPEPETAPTGQVHSGATERSGPADEQSTEDPLERAFEPDADARTADRMRRGGPFGDESDQEDPEATDDEPAREQATYGAYGASRLRRSVAASLRELPAVGKLFRPRSRTSRPSQPGRTEPEGVKKKPVRKEPVREDRAVHQRPAGAPVADERAIAEKPSPQEVQERLTLALRETSIDGFAKLAVGSPKGGVGKSSLAYAIGCAIADGTNIRVCLVDADPEFGATRSLVPRPVQSSVVELARDADSLQRLSDIRSYVAQNERMRLDVVLNPPEMVQKTRMGDLPAAYERIDTALSRFYDLVIYDMGIGFSHPQIQKVLSLSDELLLVGDSEVVPNDIFADALSYVQGLEFGLNDTTLAISHRLPPTDESATTGLVKSEHAKSLRRVTEIPYDAAFSQLLNRRAFSMDALSLDTRLGVLTTAASCLEGLRGGALSRANGSSHNRKGA